ncbi:Hypothetical predicted protein [Octopus vulgaris]|uniref:Uncharacterized protein n=2 Tax=Octopus TaxID=6643 RepID=A0AA36AHY5_OCTVU|nr:short transient receptor potential channel 4-associated protein [Octopus sinensis]CAI9716469.1 Hypothetical predicted protein [Octopus vulgaris]
MPIQLRCKRTNKISLFHSIVESQYSGHGYTRLAELPHSVIQLAGNKLNCEKAFTYIVELDEVSIFLEKNIDKCFQILKKITGRLVSFHPRRAADDLYDDSVDKFAQIFYEYNGVEIILRLLTFSSLFPSDSLSCPDSEHVLRAKSLCLEILIKIISTPKGERVISRVLSKDDILNYIFTLLAQKKTFIAACQLLEDMLQMRQEVLDLHKIHNLPGLISCLSDGELANFCRILAITISDLDIYENKSSLFAQNKQKRSNGFVNIRDVNQELLLGIPELLPRLVNITVSKAKDYTPRFPGFVSELDCWMEWIENQMDDDDLSEDANTDEFEDFVGGISVATARGSSLKTQQGLRITEDLAQRVEVVYVLGLFLLGKHRKKVQRKLAELKLAPGLSELFDQFIWKCQVTRHGVRHRLIGHNSSCECSPEVALKIQFLRLVHSFCDHSDYKHLLLSRNELNEIKNINAHAGPLALQNLDYLNKQLMCRGSKGLLTKIVEVMKKEPTTSTFRFWLARAVESYLRGNTSYCDQIFLMRRDLLQHVAGNIVKHDIANKEILQSSFDLLGELIKFNIDGFKDFDTILNTESKFNKFISTVNRNLVDSNMFIRSLILSLEHFSDDEQYDAIRKHNRLLVYIADFKQQLDYLRKLINIISVQNLTQENVSCLNTTLVFLMFANQKKILPKYLHALQDDTDDLLDVNISGSIMGNFRELLLFWQDHYLHKDKDCSALEKSSRIYFDYWKRTVKTLVEEDRNLDTSILHYIPPISSHLYLPSPSTHRRKRDSRDNLNKLKTIN